MIAVTTRWFNNERFAQRFLANWEDVADEIIVVDGGSTDNSKSILTAHPKVTWKEYHEKINGKGGGTRNPEGPHVGICLEAGAKHEWIAHTECDAWPMLGLRHVLREVLQKTDRPSVFTWLFYFAPGHKTHYGEAMAGPGLTAWRTSEGVRADITSLFEPKIIIPKHVQENALRLPKLFGRAHLTYDDAEYMQEKLDFYKKVHGLDNIHPHDMGWTESPAPDYCCWEDGPMNNRDWILEEAERQIREYI